MRVLRMKRHWRITLNDAEYGALCALVSHGKADAESDEHSYEGEDDEVRAVLESERWSQLTGPLYCDEDRYGGLKVISPASLAPPGFRRRRPRRLDF